MSIKVVIVDHREEGFELEKKVLASEDVELVICQCGNENDLINSVRDAFIIIFTSSKFTTDVINRLTNCRMLIRYGIGLDNVDIKTASEKGIYVCNTPYYGTFAVAEHTFAMLLGLNRKLILLDRNVRENTWGIDTIVPVYSLRHKTLGIVGFGNIGRYVSRMAKSFDINVTVSDPYINEETLRNSDVTSVDFDELIRCSDHISVHAPLNTETRHMFNKKVFKKMKNTATIINTGRGGLINQEDLIFALQSGQIAGAGLDVFEDEPLSVDSELLKLYNVILSPHAAWYTEESIKDLHREVVEEVLKVLHGEVPLNIVNKKQLHI
jgi:D-3-phosphoglycerate dehydrogenase / 2-oxoglutarate reductase